MSKNKPVLSLILLILIFIVGCQRTNKVLVTIDGQKIITGDLEHFTNGKRHTSEQVVSDQGALETIIEQELFYREASEQGKIITFEKAQAVAKEHRKKFEVDSSPNDKIILAKEIKKMDISEEKYWDEYYTNKLIKSLSAGMMISLLQNSIYDKITKEQPNLNKEEISKEYVKEFDKVIDNLKKKYNVQYTSK